MSSRGLSLIRADIDRNWARIVKRSGVKLALKVLGSEKRSLAAIVRLAKPFARTGADDPRF